jgi:Protein of unknown function (DUF4019)
LRDAAATPLIRPVSFCAGRERFNFSPINRNREPEAQEEKMIRKIACSVILILMFVPLVGRAEDSSKEKAAVTAAEKWLGLIDEGSYAESWKQASTILRNVVTEEQWEQMVGAVRKPLGKMVSRQVKSKTYTTTLAGAPDGEYVVIQFETSFENKKSAIETVTPMIDKDGTWRVSGYYIK